MQQYSIINSFNGYRNREDATNLDPSIMVHGSFNVLTNLSDRLSVRKGYTKFGQSYTSTDGVLGSYDLLDIPFSIPERHLKTWDTNIELLWQGFDGTSNPVWNNIKSNTTSARYNFTNFWDGDFQTQWIIGVNGTSKVFAWNTAMAGYATSTANTITKQGTTTWEQEGFDIPAVYTKTVTFAAASLPASGATINFPAFTVTDNFITAGFRPGQSIVVTGTASNDGTYLIATVTADFITIAANQDFVNEAGISATLTFTPELLINGTVYKYTGGTNTTTLTGVSPAPSGIVAGDMIIQNPHEFDLANFYTMELKTAYVLISSASQLYLGSSTSNIIQFSATNQFFVYTFSAAARLASEGGKVNFDAPPKALGEQDGDVYVSAGKNEFGKIIFQTNTIDMSGTAVTTEIPNIEKIKTSTLNASISQGAFIPLKNNFAFLSHSKKMLLLGKTQFQEAVQTSFFENDVATDLSYSVLYDFRDFDYTDATVFYDAKDEYILCTFPRNGIVMIYNQSGTEQKQYWEAPQIIPASRFAMINGEPYFHGYTTPTTYKLFDGYNDNGNPVNARAKFAFNSYGKRANLKSCHSIYIEGYIRGNTTLVVTSKFEQVGCGFSTGFSFNGANTQVVCLATAYNPLGFWPLGAQPIGSVVIDSLGNQNLPPAFQLDYRLDKIGQIPPDFNKQQLVFESSGTDQAWEIVAFGGEVYDSEHMFIKIAI